MIFEVIPAVDLKGGRCVQLVQGVPGSEVVSLPDPVSIALDWIDQGAKTLHLIDLDGAIHGKRRNAPIIRDICEVCDAYIQVGGGIRSVDDVDDLLAVGVDRVIMSTAALRNQEFVRELSDRFGSEHIMIALDAAGGEVAIEGWSKRSGLKPADLGIKFEELGAGSILFTNIDTEGLLGGIDIDPTAELVQSVSIPVIASGGITTLHDIAALRNVGAAGVVIGSALYLEKFTLADAIRV
ncbi:MAG TPA: 1-(5-phosphoribosyl)-5-[(5-phosphoribosylamino)methylideneamino]imidazole-4-carboxamide isomerase [Methanosarcinales archaeon]|nr:1-(5-phosphoribosyl)-5-[(5-phosphoribosylamino)methylideneamino]imidazole-4-carboxamide isomerase [Methanosarcinales archaeon]